MTTGFKAARHDADVVTGTGAFAITKDDTNELATYSRWIFCGGTGNLKVTCIDGSVATFTGVLAGQIIPIQAKLVWSTGTTTTNMTAIY